MRLFYSKEAIVLNDLRVETFQKLKEVITNKKNDNIASSNTRYSSSLIAISDLFIQIYLINISGMSKKFLVF